MWTGKSPGRSPVALENQSNASRLHYLDSLKVALSALVILHHAAQPYGPIDWWYVEGQPGAQWIEDFAVLNAPFKMSLFFLIAAFFLPRAVDQRRERPYIGPRLRKLGGPILVGFFVVIPVLMYAYYSNFRDYESIGFGVYYWDVYLGAGDEPENWSGPIWPDRQFGHLWFLQHLLVYSLLYLAWRSIAERIAKRRGKDTPERQYPEQVTGTAIMCFAALVAAGTAALRIWYPVDEWVPMLEIIQTEPADLAQYIPFFIAGTLAYRRGWLETLTPRVAYGWLAAAIALSIAYVLLRSDLTGFFELGGANLGSLAWSVYETVLCLGYLLGMLVFFRDHLRGTSPLQRSAASATFAIYLVHLPIVVGLQYVVRDWPLGASGKFATVAAAGFVLSVLSAILLRRIPVVRSIL